MIEKQNAFERSSFSLVSLFYANFYAQVYQRLIVVQLFNFVLLSRTGRTRWFRGCTKIRQTRRWFLQGIGIDSSRKVLGRYRSSFARATIFQWEKCENVYFRADLEATYAKGLSKLSSKLTKACAKDQGNCRFFFFFFGTSFMSLRWYIRSINNHNR